MKRVTPAPRGVGQIKWGKSATRSQRLHLKPPLLGKHCFKLFQNSYLKKKKKIFVLCFTWSSWEILTSLKKRQGSGRGNIYCSYQSSLANSFKTWPLHFFSPPRRWTALHTDRKDTRSKVGLCFTSSPPRSMPLFPALHSGNVLWNGAKVRGREASLSLGQRLRGFEEKFPLMKWKLQSTPDGKSAKRNCLSLAASVGGTLPVSSTAGTGEPGLGRWPFMVLGPGAAVSHGKGQRLRAIILWSL